MSRVATIIVAGLTVLVSSTVAPAAPAGAVPLSYEAESVIQKTIELRTANGVPSGQITPEWIVEQVLESGASGSALLSNDNYGTSIGTNEARVCATEPHDCSRARSAINDARSHSPQQYPGDPGDTKQDANRHCVWQALTTIRANAGFAERIGNAHEKDHPGTPEQNRMDLRNNEIGRGVGPRNEGNEGALTVSVTDSRTMALWWY